MSYTLVMVCSVAPGFACGAHVQLISIFGAVFRESVNPSTFGVVITYSLSAASGEYTKARPAGADV